MESRCEYSIDNLSIFFLVYCEIEIEYIFVPYPAYFPLLGVRDLFNLMFTV